MRKINLVFVLCILLMSNGCCLLAGVGMKNARDQRAEKEDNFNNKVIKGMESISGYTEKEEK